MLFFLKIGVDFFFVGIIFYTNKFLHKNTLIIVI